MDVNLIFRIAAVGILVSVICQVLKHSGRVSRHFSPVWQVWFWYCSGWFPTYMICLKP